MERFADLKRIVSKRTSSSDNLNQTPRPEEGQGHARVTRNESLRKIIVDIKQHIDLCVTNAPLNECREINSLRRVLVDLRRDTLPTTPLTCFTVPSEK
ncbi:hypothetical protein PoB_001305500 [Plakobranchus ocellatus]|uniref:Uncharacterized protein n=1 Tax=Plakobranchus ocellatus TaxID=259542 RepID=A0AAV3YUN7_9GAST|nr:hypothetical protein PoB_001305500 [Plakobranchus ocellatus]